MRLWIIISSIVILLFCVPGLLFALFALQWLNLCVCLLLNALAIHSLYYCKVARFAPARGYPHLAAGQLLLGILCTALLVRLGYALGEPALWEQARQALLALLQWGPNNMAGTPRQLEQMVDEAVQQVRRPAMRLTFWVALLTLLSQALFSWMLYRRSKLEAHKHPDIRP